MVKCQNYRPPCCKVDRDIENKINIDSEAATLADTLEVDDRMEVSSQKDPYNNYKGS